MVKAYCSDCDKTWKIQGDELIEGCPTCGERLVEVVPVENMRRVKYSQLARR